MIQEQQVLAFDIENQAFGVRGCGTEHPRVEQRIQQERRVAGFGGNAGDSADVDMRALGSVDEVEIKIDRILIAAQSGGQTAFDLVEVERCVSFSFDRSPYLSSWKRRHKGLGHDSSHLYQGCLRHLRWQDSVRNQEHVAVEAGTLVAGPNLADDSVQLQLVAVRELTVYGDDIVQLQVMSGGERYPELQWRSIIGAEHPSHAVHSADSTTKRRSRVIRVPGQASRVQCEFMRTQRAGKSFHYFPLHVDLDLD